MSALIFNGVLTGFLIGIFSYGTIFFMLIKIGIQYGFRKGALFELGHILSLILIISVISLSVLKLNDIIILKKIFCLIGFIVLVIFGAVTIKKSNKHSELLVDVNIPNHRFIIQGFLLNIINPFEFIIWTGIISTVKIKYEFSEFELFLFLAIALISLISVDLAKVFLAKQIRNKLTPIILSYIYKIVGLILICIGIFLLYYFLTLL